MQKTLKNLTSNLGDGGFDKTPGADADLWVGLLYRAGTLPGLCLLNGFNGECASSVISFLNVNFSMGLSRLLSFPERL